MSDVGYISIINSTESGSAVNVWWRIDPLLGKDRETNNETTVIAE